MATPAQPQLPTSVDLRPHLPPIRDQGTRGTCVAFAVTACHELGRANGVAVNEDLCEEVLYWGCKQIDGNLIQGTRLASADAALRNWGQPVESFWPYDPARVDTIAAFQPPPPALDPAVCFRTSLRKINPTLDAIITELANNRAVALVLRLNSVFDDPPNGRITLPGPTDHFGDLHAMLAVGNVAGSHAGDGDLILRNSWTEDWGDGGYGYLPYEFIRKYPCRAAWVRD